MTDRINCSRYSTQQNPLVAASEALRRNVYIGERYVCQSFRYILQHHMGIKRDLCALQASSNYIAWTSWRSRSPSCWGTLINIKKNIIGIRKKNLDNKISEDFITLISQISIKNHFSFITVDWQNLSCCMI